MPENTMASDVGFAEFVAVLLVETLDSIVASHTSQEDRLRALHAAASLTPEEVAATAITAELVDATLAELFPDDAGATTVRVGGPVPDENALAELEVTLTANSVTDATLTASGVQRVRSAVALFLAKRHLASVQEVTRRGVPRVLVEGGTLRAKLSFTARRSGGAAPPATASSRGAAPSSGGTAAPLRLRDTLTSRDLALKPEILDSIRDLRLIVTPPPATAEPGVSASQTDLLGEVEIRFRTEV